MCSSTIKSAKHIDLYDDIAQQNKNNHKYPMNIIQNSLTITSHTKLAKNLTNITYKRLAIIQHYH